MCRSVWVLNGYRSVGQVCKLESGYQVHTCGHQVSETLGMYPLGFSQRELGVSLGLGSFVCLSMGIKCILVGTMSVWVPT